MGRANGDADGGKPGAVAKSGRKSLEEKLTDQHWLFIRNYARYGRVKTACKVSGFGEGHAYQNLLKSAAILKEVEKIRNARSKKYEITSERIQLEAARLAFSTLADFSVVDEETGELRLDFSEVGLDELAAIGEIRQDTYFEGRGEDAVPIKKTEIKLHKKMPAIEMLARIQRLFGVDRDGNNNNTSLDPGEKAARVRQALLEIEEVENV